MTNGLAQAAREPLLLVTGEHGRTAASGGFIVFGGLLIAESSTASFSAAIASGCGSSYHDVIEAAARHNVHLVANMILESIAASNSHAHESGDIVVGTRAMTIARQWRQPLQTLDGAAALPLLLAANCLVTALARGLGALEAGRADPGLASVMALFPVTSTGQRNRAALTARPAKIIVTQYRNRYHRLFKALDALPRQSER